MTTVGITGSKGFIGTHLSNTLRLYPERFSVVPLNRELEGLEKCEVVVHLAALNRHPEPGIIYNTNISLVKQLIYACNKSEVKPHIIFASSIQENNGSAYGRSKKEGALLFERWAEKSKAQFTKLVIPNVYGPFGKPFYNSVVATFCYQLTHNKEPRIDVDNEVKLVYVGDVVNGIIDTITESDNFLIWCKFQITVSSLLKKLTLFKENYFNKGILPDLSNAFDKNLFTTLLCYVDHSSFFPFPLKLNSDERGDFVEIIRPYSGGQVSFSTTLPGITRGNHFHTRKIERFAVIKGKARIDLRRVGTNEVMSFELIHPSFVDIPIWYTHNITNIGEDELYTIFWINEHYNPDDADTFYEKV